MSPDMSLQPPLPTDLERLLALVGPTAAGKTALAMRIAGPLRAEIISVDSMQVYRGMDIGTGKPTADERREVEFHLLDVADPGSDFSVAAFKELADSAIAGIRARRRVPLLVGGSGLYYRAVVDDLDFSNVGGEDEYRVEVQEELEDMPDVELHAVLEDLDPRAAREIPPSNRRRVMKAIEVARYGDRLISERQHSWTDFSSPYDLRVAGLLVERKLLNALIDARVDAMMSGGLLDEVARLREAGLRRGSTAGEALGYRQLIEHLEGRSSLEEAVSDVKSRTRAFARRQMTWYGKDPRIRWFEVEGDPDDPVRSAAAGLERVAGPVLEYLSDNPEN